MTAPNLAPSGVIQNPGIGAILGGGFSQLAQFLQQRQQAEAQQQLQQQQLALQSQQVGQGQQRIDMERAQQQYAQQLALQQQAEARRREQAIGQGLGMLAQPPETVSSPLMVPGQLGQPDLPIATLTSKGAPIEPGQVAQQMRPEDFASLTATPGFKSIMEQRAADAKARAELGKLSEHDPTKALVNAQGQTVVAATPEGLKATDVPSDVRGGLFALGLPMNTDPTTLSPAARQQVMAAARSLAQARTQGVDINLELDKAAIPEFIKQGTALAQASVKAKEDNLNIKNALQALNSGALTGPGADLQTGFYSLASKLGFGDAASATNTQELLQATASRIIPIPQGISRLTNAELEFLKTIKANKATLNAETIRHTLELAKKANDATIFDNNKKLRASRIPGFLQQMYYVDPAAEEDYSSAFGKVKPSGTP